MTRKDIIFMLGLLLLAASRVGAAPQAANRGSIDGVVLRGASEDPAANVRVRLIAQSTGNLVSGTTDHQGKFAFKALQAGDYRLAFESDGYVRQILPPGEELLKLADGQSLRDLTVRLTPTGIISGRVVDRSGQPIGNVPVRLTGERLSREVVTRSNDRGEYRFFFITPGAYWVAAGEEGDANNVVRSNGAANRFDEQFDLTYFPGVPDRNSSRVLGVKPGEELSGTDIVMGNARVPVSRLPGQGEKKPADQPAPPPSKL